MNQTDTPSPAVEICPAPALGLGPFDQNPGPDAWLEQSRALQPKPWMRNDPNRSAATMLNEQPLPLPRWEYLPGLPIDEFLTPALKKRIKALNEAIANLLKKRAGLEESIRRNSDADVKSIDFDNLVGLPAIRLLYISLLQDELKLRAEIETVEGQIADAIRIECDRLIALTDEKRAWLRAELVRLGYQDVAPEMPIPEKIMPGFVEANPHIYGPRREAQALQARSSTCDSALANEEAAERIEAALQQIKRRASAL